ncbi:hypothetical protein K450DRAFT_226075 [Umbelopsis ramanniana AG]|uniref:Uncharacterized protein n=1 Tax=Umbelopsis ramanniana AG TaxID=1314678 RepID=A0AAD5EEX2_UMBRA|nr:uncharacterized protein K450DRAFT_226075 [Umbelopsis ramanniana AG]KAI8582606.1 hypothetical protein K450DRAFT_226075 [Umbelopsis ramanniana AG]
MDIDDDSFAEDFDEDLVRAVEEQESQYFGNYTTSYADKAELTKREDIQLESHGGEGDELSRLKTQLLQKERQISEQRALLEQLRTSIRYENESKVSMEQQMANKDKLIANKDGELLSARQQIRMLDGRLRLHAKAGEQQKEPKANWDKEQSLPPSTADVDGLASRKRQHRALPTSMFLGPKIKRPKVLPRTKTPEVEAVNYQMQETHVTSPKKENEKATINEKEKLLRSLLCDTFYESEQQDIAMDASIIGNTAQLTQLYDMFIKRFTPLQDEDMERELQDLSLLLFECLVEAPNVSLSWTLRQFTNIFSQYIMITQRNRTIKLLQPAIHALHTLTRQYDAVKEQLLRTQVQDKEKAALNNLLLSISFFPSPDFESQYKEAYEKREAIANLKHEPLINMDAYMASYNITLSDLEYDSEKDKMLSHKALLDILGIFHGAFTSVQPGQSECLYFLRDKSFISLLHVDRPVVIIQHTLQVILDQLTACCMPVHLATSDHLALSGSEKLVTEPLIEQLSNNVDNFRSILDCMTDLIKYKCKDEREEIEWQSVRLTVVNIIDIVVSSDSSSELSDEMQLVLVMISTYLNMEIESTVSQRKTRLTAKSKLTLNLSVTIVYQLFQQTPVQTIHENLDSVLKETLKKSMSGLKAIKDQWDSGDAVLIDDILQIIDGPADVKMEVTAV